jgi:hypothetical protein
LWRSIEVTLEHPLFGVGPGNFEVTSGVWHVTHNSYTQMSSEGGIPALVLFIVILSYGFKNLRRAKRLSGHKKELKLLAKALRGSLAGFVVGAFFASYAYQFFPYFLVAYSTALLRIVRDTPTARQYEPANETAPEMETESIEPEVSWDLYPDQADRVSLLEGPLL